MHDPLAAQLDRALRELAWALEHGLAIRTWAEEVAELAAQVFHVGQESVTICAPGLFSAGSELDRGSKSSNPGSS